MLTTDQIIQELLHSGLSAEQMALIMQLMASISIQASTANRVDGTAEKRRAWDRERKRLKSSTGIPPENRVENPPEFHRKNGNSDYTSLSILPSLVDKTLEANNKKKVRDSNVPAREKQSRGTRIPPEWKPSEQHFSTALAKGFGREWVLEQSQAMVIWGTTNAHRAVARKIDWDLTFNGWMLRGIKDDKANSARTNSRPNRSNESAFLTGVAKVAARYGVQAGMGQVADNPDAKPIINLTALSDRSPPDGFGETLRIDIAE